MTFDDFRSKILNFTHMLSTLFLKNWNFSDKFSWFRSNFAHFIKFYLNFDNLLKTETHQKWNFIKGLTIIIHNWINSTNYSCYSICLFVSFLLDLPQLPPTHLSNKMTTQSCQTSKSSRELPASKLITRSSLKAFGRPTINARWFGEYWLKKDFQVSRQSQNANN